MILSKDSVYNFINSMIEERKNFNYNVYVDNDVKVGAHCHIT